MEKNADISKIEEAYALKGIFSETKYKCVLTYQIWSFSIILTGFRQEVILPSYSSQNEPLKSPPRLGLKMHNYYL